MLSSSTQEGGAECQDNCRRRKSASQRIDLALVLSSTSAVNAKIRHIIDMGCAWTIIDCFENDPKLDKAKRTALAGCLAAKISGQGSSLPDRRRDRSLRLFCQDLWRRYAVA